MATLIAKKPRASGVLRQARTKSRAIGADVLHQAQTKGLALAAGALPKIAKAAELTGQSIARASNNAGHAAGEKLRLMEPGTAATLASAFAASGMVGPILRFAFRRPLAAIVGGVILAQAGKMVWDSMHRAQPAEPAPQHAGG